MVSASPHSLSRFSVQLSLALVLAGASLPGSAARAQSLATVPPQAMVSSAPPGAISLTSATLTGEQAALPQVPSTLLAVSAALPFAPSAAISAWRANEEPDPDASASGPPTFRSPAPSEFPQVPKDAGPPDQTHDVDINGNPIPVDRHQTRRIGGIFPNYRAVSGGAVAHPPGWKYNFSIATHQAFDYSGFIFLGITSISAEGLNEHPAFGKGPGGFWTYTWHGFVDKTDGTYIQAWFLPSLLHEDTRYYALGNQYPVSKRIIHVVDRQVITRSYSGHDTLNVAGFGGKVLTQYISTFYYPTGSATFGKLAEKFSFSVARDIGFTALREFYPDYLGYKARKKGRKAQSESALDQAAAAAAGQSQSPAPSNPSPKP